jgi:hypothetical protein
MAVAALLVWSPFMRQVLLTVAILYALIAYAIISAASACDEGNSCLGIVKVGKEWSTITDDVGQPGPDGPHVCRFLTASKVGRQILSKCPDGSRCYVEMPRVRGEVGMLTNTIVKKVTFVSREKMPM